MPKTSFNFTGLTYPPMNWFNVTKLPVVVLVLPSAIPKILSAQTGKMVIVISNHLLTVESIASTVLQVSI